MGYTVKTLTQGEGERMAEGTLELKSKLKKTVGYKSNIQKSIALLITNNELCEIEITKGIPLTIPTKLINKPPRNTFNQRGKRSLY
jgi:hypothetical protein